MVELLPLDSAAIPTTMLSVDVAVTPVDRTRTLVFSSSQVAGGQGAGELSSAAASDGYQGAAARFELLASGATVRVTSGRQNGAALFTFYVVEIEP